MKKVISIIISILLIAALAAPAVFAAGEQKTHNYDDYINYRDPLANTYRRLTEDKKLKAVYFGGSVTAGYGRRLKRRALFLAVAVERMA